MVKEKSSINCLSGYELLSCNWHNKGTAFSMEERRRLNLLGKLPPKIETLAEQKVRAYRQYCARKTPFEKSLFLYELFATNAVLFFALASEYLSEMLPVIYTPTVGDVVMQYSGNFMRQHGLVISYTDLDDIETILADYDADNLDIAVVTDGEGVLGIGDQGIGGLSIALGKLMVYTLCGGISPLRTLPIQLDVGTNNQQLLADPLYLGWRHERITGKQYLHFIDKFVSAFSKKFPHTLLHWEDFGRDNARVILERYRNVHRSFNDDIQGTGAVALAAVLNGMRLSGVASEDHRFCILGAGTAGTGIADQISKGLGFIENRDPEMIRKRFYLIDRAGLVIAGQPGVLPFQQPYAKRYEEIEDWQVADYQCVSLFEVVKNAKPTVLIGCSACAGAFTDEIIREMYSYTKKPVIMPLSNPIAKAEATPERLLKLTDGNALIATGSPFGTVKYGGCEIVVSQCNNALIFPGIAMGMLISDAGCVSDSMLFAASKALVGIFHENGGNESLLPDFSDTVQLTGKIGVAVAMQAVAEGLAKPATEKSLRRRVEDIIWSPRYFE